MDEYTDYMSSLEDKDLLVAFEECQTCRETGILIDGKAREIGRKWAELSNTKVLPPMTIVQEISNEMAKRYYELKK